MCTIRNTARVFVGRSLIIKAFGRLRKIDEKRFLRVIVTRNNYLPLSIVRKSHLYIYRRANNVRRLQ